MFRIASMLVMLVTVLTVKAQFIAKYTSPGHDVEFTAIADYGDSNVIVAGTEGNRLLLVEYGPSGFIENKKSLIIESENGLSPAKSMIVDSDGNIVVAGYKIEGSDTYGESGNGYVLKYDWAADSIIFCTINDNAGSKFFKIVEISAGSDYFVCGQNHHPIDLSNILVRIDRNTGELFLIDNSSHHPLSDSYYSMDYADGYFYITTRTQYFGGGTDKMRACQVKMDTVGNISYVKSYIKDTVSTARLYSADIASMGTRNIQLIHGDDNGTNVNNDLYIVNTKLNGDVAWTKKYDFSDVTNDGIWHSAKVFSGNKILTVGSLYNGTDAGGDIFLMALNNKGKVVWAKSYDFRASKYYYLGRSDIMATNNTDIAVVGATNELIDGYTAGVIMKVKIENQGVLSEGCYEMHTVTATNKTNNSIPTVMTNYDYDDTFSAGFIESVDTEFDLFGIYCQNIGARTHSDDIHLLNSTSGFGSANSNIYVYPNPANTYLWISNNEESPYSAIAIYDMQGRLIENKAIAADQKNWIEVDVQNIPSGMYIIQGLDAQGNKLANFSFIKE